MFDRVKEYTIVTIAMNFAFAYACLLGKGSFSMDKYTGIGHIMPLGAWGVMFILVAAALLYGLFKENILIYRIAIAMSGGILVTWGIALVYNMIEGNTTGPIGPVLLFVVAADKLIIASTPVIRSIDKKNHSL